MLRRLLPTLLILGAGFAALTAFLVGLELVFLAEDERGAQQEAQNRLALESYASVTLQRMIRDDWENAAERVEQVLADPLRDEGDLVLVSDGAQVLPRVAGPDRGVKERYQRLVAEGKDPGGAGADPDDPWAERVQHLERLRASLAAKDRPGIEKEVRFLLEHRTRWLLPPAQDLPFTLAMLELLTQGAKPSPQLTRMVLRDGLGEARASTEGLERQVLRAWPTLGKDDLAFLCAEVVRQAQRGGVASEDFEARCEERPQARLGLPELEPGLWLLEKPFGAVVRVTPSEVRGSTLQLAIRLEQLTTEMQLRGLLEATDELSFSPAPLLELKAVRVAVHADRFSQAERARREALRLKTALLLVTFVLGGGIVGVALVAQRRKLRYLELKSDFVSTVSHELRTPLASLRLLAETLERKLDGHAPAKDYPQRILSEVDSLSALVENILSFNRIDKGRWAPRLAEWRPAELVPLLEDDARRYPSAKVELSFTGLEGLRLRADPELMRMLFQNLLRNACKYNARDPVRFRVEAAASGGSVHFRVSDNGVGIAEGQREAVFETFHRLAAQGGRGGGGSGLGLALCRRIAALHRGTLTVQASSPEGTTFELVLPTG